MVKNSVTITLLPPTRGALIQHIRRAFIQASIWEQATQATIIVVQPEEYGWEYSNGNYALQTTDEPIVPDALVELMSCGCRGV